PDERRNSRKEVGAEGEGNDRRSSPYGDQYNGQHQHRGCKDGFIGQLQFFFSVFQGRELREQEQSNNDWKHHGVLGKNLAYRVVAGLRRTEHVLDHEQVNPEHKKPKESDQISADADADGLSEYGERRQRGPVRDSSQAQKRPEKAEHNGKLR